VADSMTDMTDAVGRGGTAGQGMRGWQKIVQSRSADKWQQNTGPLLGMWPAKRASWCLGCARQTTPACTQPNGAPSL